MFKSFIAVPVIAIGLAGGIALAQNAPPPATSAPAASAPASSAPASTQSKTDADRGGATDEARSMRGHHRRHMRRDEARHHDRDRDHRRHRHHRRHHEHERSMEDRGTGDNK